MFPASTPSSRPHRQLDPMHNVRLRRQVVERSFVLEPDELLAADLLLDRRPLHPVSPDRIACFLEPACLKLLYLKLVSWRGTEQTIATQCHRSRLDVLCDAVVDWPPLRLDHAASRDGNYAGGDYLRVAG